MGILAPLGPEERLDTGIRRKKDVSMHILNKKADKKLDYVTLGFETAMGDRHGRTRREPLARQLECSGFKHLTNLRLDYLAYENRLWAFAYNLNLRATLEASGEGWPRDEELRFAIESKGRLKISAPRWTAKGGGDAEDFVERCLAQLNHALILSRVELLDMSKVSLVYNPRARRWTLEYRSIIGSTNWILIPPVMQLIKYRPEEVVRTLEFFELVFEAVDRAREETSVPKMETAL